MPRIHIFMYSNEFSFIFSISFLEEKKEKDDIIQLTSNSAILSTLQCFYNVNLCRISPFNLP